MDNQQRNTKHYSQNKLTTNNTTQYQMRINIQIRSNHSVLNTRVDNENYLQTNDTRQCHKMKETMLLVTNNEPSSTIYTQSNKHLTRRIFTSKYRIQPAHFSFCWIYTTSHKYDQSNKSKSSGQPADENLCKFNKLTAMQRRMRANYCTMNFSTEFKPSSMLLSRKQCEISMRRRIEKG